MSPNPSLAAEMQSATSEIYLFDAVTLEVVDANQAARLQLGYDNASLCKMTAFQLAPSLDCGAVGELLQGLSEDVGAQVALRTRLRRADGSSYPVKLCFLRIVRDGQRLLLAIGEDLSLEQAATLASSIRRASTPSSTTRRAWSTSSCCTRTGAATFPT